MRLEDHLEGDVDFSGWKLRMKITLKENGLMKFFTDPNPPAKGSNEYEKWEMDNIKEMRLIVDVVKTHLLPLIFELEIAHEMRMLLRTCLRSTILLGLLLLETTFPTLK